MDSKVIALLAELNQRYEELSQTPRAGMLIERHRGERKRSYQKKVLQRVNHEILKLLVRKKIRDLDSVFKPIDRVVQSYLLRTECGSPEEEGILQFTEEVAHRVSALKERDMTRAVTRPRAMCALDLYDYSAAQAAH